MRSVIWMCGVVSGVMLAGAASGGEFSGSPDQSVVLSHWTGIGVEDALGTSIRSGRIVLDEETVGALAGMGGRLVEVSLFEDVRLTLALDRREDFGEGRFTWTGRHGADAGDWYVLSVVAGTVTGTFWTADGDVYELLPDGAGYVSREIEVESYAPCGTCAQGAPVAEGDDGVVERRTGERNQQDDGSEIDVMIVYTPAARDAMGGVSGIESLAQSAITSTNSAYANSQIDTRLRLVSLGLVDYQESGDMSTDLSRLRGTSDGFMDGVHAERNGANADLVAMLTAGGQFCGIAYLMTNLSTGFASNGFSVTSYTCAVGNLTFAHELGHNKGCAHDRDNAGTALFPYSYGHRWTTTSGTLRRSVMAYSPGSRRPIFSNPLVTDGGAPTGVENLQDNARSINEAALTVANFRVSTPAPPPPPPPSAPGPFALVNPSDGSGGVDPNAFLTMTWESSERADAYVVRIGRNAELTDLVVGPIQRSSPNLTIFSGTFQPATEYFWSVVATNANPESTDSTPSVASFTTVGFDAGCTGDINGDDVVDLGDFNILATNFGSGPGASAPSGDLTGDGWVDLADFNILATNFGSACN